VYVNNLHSLQELKDNIQTEVANISIQQLHHCSANISEYMTPVKLVVRTSRLYAILPPTKNKLCVWWSYHDSCQTQDRKL